MEQLWRRVAATRYTRALEAEVARLRAENRALLNSILGIAGVPPITVEAAPGEGFAAPAVDAASAADTDEKNERDPSSLRSLGMTTKNKTEKRGVQAASPMRRRSWQQINRALEFESARKKERPGHADAGTNGPEIGTIRA